MTGGGFAGRLVPKLDVNYPGLSVLASSALGERSAPI
jgi:hypothetical protein